MPQAFSVIAGVMGPRVVEISVEEHAAATVKAPEAADVDNKVCIGLRCFSIFSQTCHGLRRSPFPFVQPAE